MSRRGLARALVLAALPMMPVSQAAAVAPQARVAVLARGLNVAHWLRFPPSDDDARLRDYLDDDAVAALKRAGFTYLRVPVGLEVVMRGRHVAPDKLRAVLAIVRRVQRAGLGVMLEPHPQDVGHWDFGRNEEARRVLLGFWHDVAPALRDFPAALTFPELVNEPTDDPAGWDRLQGQLLQVIRAALPQDTVVLTGTNWSSLDGLLKVQPVADADVVYSFHTYEPTLLTLLGVWDPGIDRNQLAAAMPFPVSPAACQRALARVAQAHTRAVLQYWCSEPHDDATVAAYLRRATDWGRQHGVSVIMGEFGAASALNRPARDAYLASMRHAAEALHLPWALWALDDQMGFEHPFDGAGRRLALAPDVTRDLALER